jgi:hypothetical protein
MKNISMLVIYSLVFICGGCAVSEVVMGSGTVLGLCLVISGLSLILYIVGLPVEGGK